MWVKPMCDSPCVTVHARVRMCAGMIASAYVRENVCLIFFIFNLVYAVLL